MRPGTLTTVNALLSATVATLIIAGALWAIVRPNLVLAKDLQPLIDAISEQGKSIASQASSLRTIERFILLEQIDVLTRQIAALEFLENSRRSDWTLELETDLARRRSERTRAETSLAALE